MRLVFIRKKHKIQEREREIKILRGALERSNSDKNCWGKICPSSWPFHRLTLGHGPLTDFAMCRMDVMSGFCIWAPRRLSRVPVDWPLSRSGVSAGNCFPSKSLMAIDPLRSLSSLHRQRSLHWGFVVKPSSFPPLLRPFLST